MISVYLCDDETAWLKRLNKAVTDYQIKSNWELSVKCMAASPEQLLQHLTRNPPAKGIYFLDIDLKASINGLQLARQIRKIDPKASLILLSDQDEMVMEIFRFKLEALEFLKKDDVLLPEQIQQCLQYLEDRCTSEHNTADAVTIRANGSYYTISPQDIYYVETVKNTHKVCIFLKHTIYFVPASISSLKKRLGEDFFQCHKACLVNLRHIRELHTETHQIILDNENCCSCSVREWKRLVSRFTSSSHTSETDM